MMISILDFRTLKLEILELDDKCLTGMDHGSITSTGTVRVIVTVFTN